MQTETQNFTGELRAINTTMGSSKSYKTICRCALDILKGYIVTHDIRDNFSEVAKPSVIKGMGRYMRTLPKKNGKHYSQNTIDVYCKYLESLFDLYKTTANGWRKKVKQASPQVNFTHTVETITPETAKKYLATMVVNRKRSLNHTNFLARQMQEGKWKLNGESIKFNTDGQLCDGQHRLEACILANTPFQTLVLRNCNPDDFTTYDTGKVRSASDVISIKFSDAKNINVMSSIVGKYLKIKNGGNSYSSINGSNTKFNITNEKVLDEITARKEYWDGITKLQGKLNSRTIKVPSLNVVMAEIAYLEGNGYDGEKMREFLLRTTDSRDTESTTVNTLRDYIYKEAMKKTNRKQANSDDAVNCAVLYAMKSYLNGRTVKTLQFDKYIETTLKTF